MNCSQMEALIGAMIDGELGAVQRWRVLNHLRGCADCAGQYARLQQLRDRIHSETPRHAMSERFRDRMTAVVLAAEPEPFRRPVNPASGKWQWISIGALAGCAFTLIGIAGGETLLAWRARQDIAVEAVADHVRANLDDHVIEVASSDRHTVKPWLSARLNYAPPVRDLAGAGYTLLGGRLDTLAGRRVAALVYRFRLHTIDLYVGPEDELSMTNVRQLRGFHLASTQVDGMTCIAVSDVSPDILDDFLQALKAEPGGVSAK